MLIDRAIAVLEATPSVMRAMLGGCPDELVAAADEDGWSARDVVAHLASRQGPAISGRVRAILADPGGPVPDVPEDLMQVERYRPQRFDEQLREFAEGRRTIVAELRSITPEQLTLRGRHSEVGEISVADVIHHVAYHDLVHIAQAAELAAQPLEPLRGAMRRFR